MKYKLRKNLIKFNTEEYDRLKAKCNELEKENKNLKEENKEKEKLSSELKMISEMNDEIKKKNNELNEKLTEALEEWKVKKIERDNATKENDKLKEEILKLKKENNILKEELKENNEIINDIKSIGYLLQNNDKKIKNKKIILPKINNQYAKKQQIKKLILSGAIKGNNIEFFKNHGFNQVIMKNIKNQQIKIRQGITLPKLCKY